MTRRVHLRSLPAAHQRQRGLTLIEMMVTLVIGAVLSLAIFAVLAVAESRKRTTTSVNDVQQAGNYAVYAIDKLVRSAGSGFAQSADTSFGCLLFASNAGGQVLPRTAAPPEPFALVNTGTADQFRLAPVLIAPGQTTPGVSAQASDVLVVMSGAAGFGEAPTTFLQPSAAGANTVNLMNTVSFNAGDLLLLVDQLDAGHLARRRAWCSRSPPAFREGRLSCWTSAAPITLPRSARGQCPPSATSAVAMNLGNAASGNMPTLALIGVGDNNTLFSYDLLQGAAASTPIADGVFELHAVYGVDSDNDGRIDAWADPAASAELRPRGADGRQHGCHRATAADQGAARRRDPAYVTAERDVVAPATLTMLPTWASLSREH